MKKQRPRQISISFACSYLILLIIPILMGISTYRNSIQLSRSNIIAANEIALSQFGEAIDNSLDSAGQFAISIHSMQKSILSFSSKISHSGEQVYAVRSAIDSLPIYIDSNGLFSEYFIIVYKTNIIVSPRVGYLNSHSYFSTHFDPQKLNYSLWYDALKNKSIRHIRAIPYEGSDSLLLYIHPFCLFGGAKPNHAVVFTLDTNMLHRQMQPLMESGVSQMYILNQSGELLLDVGDQTAPTPDEFLSGIDCTVASSFEQTINQEQMLVSVWKGNSFTLISMIPHAVIAQRASSVRQTIFIYLILYILTEILLGIWIMHRNQQPVSRMIHHLKNIDDNPFRVGLSDIENAVESLSANAKSLKNNLQEQRQILRSAYVNRLVFGDIIDESETEYHLEQVGFFIEGSIMRGIYMHWKTELPLDSTLNWLHTRVIEILESFAPELQFINLNSAYRFALLYAAAEPDDDHHNELLRALYTRLKLEMNIDVSFFIGHPCTRLKNVHESFSAAAALMNSTPDEGERFLFEVENCMSENDFNMNLMREEQKLINLLAVGNMDAIDKLLNELYRECFQVNEMDCFTQKLFYYRLIGTLVSANSNIMLPPELKYSISSLSPSQFFDLVRTQCEKLCNLNWEKKQQQANELIHRIVEYIDQNYNNPEISLYSVAVKFGLTESYLSLFIKEKLGETFSARVERQRITKANQLLLETNLRIEQISEQIGYTNANTFRRAFRRVQGFSPSDYRAKERE
jgi:two-component system response regulator YesN